VLLFGTNSSPSRADEASTAATDTSSYVLVNNPPGGKPPARVEFPLGIS
jgi:hypothetical protein